MRKPIIYICENNGANQLRSNCEADQHLCFRHMDSTIPLLLISKVSSFWLYSVIVQPGLCRTWSYTRIVGFLMHRIILYFTGQFFYGKVPDAKVHDAELVTPKFMLNLNKPQWCVRFSYYLRGEIDLGLSVYKEEFYR